MSEPEVRTAGVRFGPKIRGKLYMRVDVRLFAGGGLATIQSLANALMLNPQELFTAICAPVGSKLGKLNRDALLAMARAQGLPAGSLAAARAALIERAHTPVANTISVGWHDAFLDFVIVPEVAVTVPVSSAFKNAFERQKTLQVLRPKFATLSDRLTELEQKASRLELILQFVREAGQGNVPEMAIIEGVIALADVMLDEKKNDTSSFQRTASARMKTFRDRLAAFKPHAYRALVQRPRAFVLDPTHLPRRDQLPAELLALLQDAAFVDAVGAAAKHPHLVEPALWDRLIAVLVRVAEVLLASPPNAAGRDFAIEFLDTHVIPMIHAIAGKDIPNLDAILANASDAELKRFIKSDWAKLIPAGSGPSAYALLGAAASVTLSLASNLEGPYSLGLAVLSHSAPALIERSVSSLTNAKPLAATIYRFICQMGNLTQQDRVKVLVLLDQRDLKLMKAELAGKLGAHSFRGVAGRGIVALLTLAVFATVVTQDEEASLKRVSDLIGAAGLGVLGLAQSTAQLQRLFERGAAQIGLRALAGIVVVASVVSAVQQMGVAEDRGDSFGYYQGYVVIGSAGLSVAGWLLVVGASTSWAGVGEVLMAAGAILGAGVVVFGVVQGFLMDGTEKFIKGSMHRLARGLPGEANTFAGPIATAAALEPKLGQDFAALVKEADDLVYWALPAARRNVLRDRGFSDEAAALIAP